MHARKISGLSASAVAFVGALYAFQQPFREYPGVEYNNFPLPADYQEKTEWTFKGCPVRSRDYVGETAITCALFV